MKTLIAQPDHPFQNAGEVCESCREFWIDQGIEPRTMVMVFDLTNHQVMTTDNKHIPIVVCPHCDGELILRHSK